MQAPLKARCFPCANHYIYQLSAISLSYSCRDTHRRELQTAPATAIKAHVSDKESCMQPWRFLGTNRTGVALRRCGEVALVRTIVL